MTESHRSNCGVPAAHGAEERKNAAGARGAGLAGEHPSHDGPAREEDRRGSLLRGGGPGQAEPSGKKSWCTHRVVTVGASAFLMAAAVLTAVAIFSYGGALRGALAGIGGIGGTAGESRSAPPAPGMADRLGEAALPRRDASEIQRRIDAAPAGSVIDIEPGIYTGSITMRGRSITLRSREGAVRTVLEGAAAGGPIVIMRHAPEDGSWQLIGFTIRGAQGAAGTGVLIENAHPVLSRCIIERNAACGIRLVESRAIIDECRLAGNSAAPFGGGAHAIGGNPVFVSCRFEGNAALTGGGALYAEGGEPMVLACTFESNRSTSGAWGGAIFSDGAELVVLDSDFIGNRSGEEGAAIFARGGRARVERCAFEANASRSAWALLSHGATVEVTASRFCGPQEWNLSGAGVSERGNAFIAECMRDCNGNGIPDDVEISDEIVTDCDGTGVPDGCKLDCDRDGLPDVCAISMGLVRDEDGNGVPDSCEQKLGDLEPSSEHAFDRWWPEGVHRTARPMKNPPARASGLRD